jgi:type VI secretion system secreted protein Hcp
MPSFKSVVSSRRARLAAVGVGAVASIGAAAAIAATLSPDANGVIHGCYDRQGRLRIVNAGQACDKGEIAIEWNQQGPVGPAGPIGAVGPAGPPGADGRDGRDGLQGPAGAQGPQGVAGPAGPAGPAGASCDSTGGGGGSAPVATDDMFLKIDGIDGESSDFKHKGEIDVESFSWGVKQSGSLSTGGGGGAGQTQITDFNFVKHIDKASPKLALATATGQHFKFAELTVRRAARDQVEYLSYKLEDLLVSSVNVSGSGSGNPVETISLNFSKLEIEYRPQKADGSLDASITAIISAGGAKI